MISVSRHVVSWPMNASNTGQACTVDATSICTTAAECGAIAVLLPRPGEGILYSGTTLGKGHMFNIGAGADLQGSYRGSLRMRSLTFPWAMRVH